MLEDVDSLGLLGAGPPLEGKGVMKPQSVENRFSATGFTLVEVLVVVSVIGLLISLLLGVVGRARAAATMAVCKQNQRTMFLGLFTYADKYGRLPNTHMPVNTNKMPTGGWWCTDPDRIGEFGPDYPDSYNTGPSLVDDTCDGRMWFWQQQAGHMFEDRIEAMSCPASMVGRPDDTGNPDQRYSGHYGSGVTLMRRPPEVACRTEPGGRVRWDRQGWQSDHVSMKFDDIRESASVALLWDSGSGFMSHAQAKSPRGFAWYVPGYWNNKNQPLDDQGERVGRSQRILKSFETDAYRGRHPNNRINVIYVDGHADDMAADSFVDGKGAGAAARERSWRTMWYERPDWIEEYYHPHSVDGAD